MKQTQIIFSFFFPPRQNAAEAVHPAMRPLHHPAACFESGLPLDGLGFLAPRLDVGGIPELFHQVAHVVVIVPFVQAYALRILPGGFGRLTGMLSKVASTILES